MNGSDSSSPCPRRRKPCHGPRHPRRSELVPAAPSPQLLPCFAKSSDDRARRLLRCLLLPLFFPCQTNEQPLRGFSPSPRSDERTRNTDDHEHLLSAVYFDHIKPKPVVTEKKTGYICKICGYIYEGDTLPEDFICPLCKHGAADFEKIQ